MNAGKDRKKNTSRKPDTAVSLFESGATGISTLLHTGVGVNPSFVKDILIGKQPIVGARFRGGSDQLMEDLDPGSKVTFLREPDNRFDSRAVMALDEKGRQIGYIPRSDNRLMSALMDAGKRFYGIVCVDPATSDPRGKGTPSQIWVDLYMQEFTMPGEMAEIPRQESEGSYVVLYHSVNSGEKRLGTVYALRVINGEERGSFSRKFPADPAENADYQKSVEELSRFIGRLPVVCFNTSGNWMKALENAWGLVLGLPFSNHVIDLKVMAETHIHPGRHIRIEELAGFLNIEPKGITKKERMCRLLWESYRRLDKQEFGQKSKNAEVALRKAKMSDEKKQIREALHKDLLAYLFGRGSDNIEEGEEDWLTAVTAMEMAVELGFNGDYSGIGTLYLAGGHGLEKDTETGFLWQKRFYDDYKAGKLDLKDKSSLVSVCSNLAIKELWEIQDRVDHVDELDDDDLEVPLNLWKEAVDIAAELEDPSASMSSANTLMTIGCTFHYGEVHTQGHEEILIAGDSFYAKKALKEAVRRGNKDAEELLEEILETEPD